MVIALTNTVHPLPLGKCAITCCSILLRVFLPSDITVAGSVVFHIQMLSVVTLDGHSQTPISENIHS